MQVYTETTGCPPCYRWGAGFCPPPPRPGDGWHVIPKGGARPTGHLPGGEGGNEAFPGGGEGGNADGSKGKEGGCESQGSRSKGPGVTPCLIRHRPACPVYNRPVLTRQVQNPWLSPLHSGRSILKTFPDSLSCKPSGLGSSLPMEVTGFRTSSGQPTRQSDTGSARL